MLGKLMVDASRHEYEIAGLKRVAVAIVIQNPTTAYDEVELVLRVRCLLSGRAGNRKRDVQGVSLQHVGGVFATGTGDSSPGLRKVDHMAALAGDHDRTHCCIVRY